MKDREHYQQGALSFSTATEQPQPQGRPAESDHFDVEALAAQVPAIARDPEPFPPRTASGRMPNDFWQEFHLEWEFREQHGMVPVSPAEFADMRDWSDRLIEPEYKVWPHQAVGPSYEKKVTE